jgi:hypothetical protein
MLSPAVVTPFISRITFDRVRTVGRSSVAAISPVMRTPVAAVLVAMSYYAGSKIDFFFTPSETPIAIFWPPNAILLSFLLLTRPRIWGVFLATVLPAHLLIQLSLGIPLLPTLGGLREMLARHCWVPPASDSSGKENLYLKTPKDWLFSWLSAFYCRRLLLRFWMLLTLF